MERKKIQWLVSFFYFFLHTNFINLELILIFDENSFMSQICQMPSAFFELEALHLTA